MSAKVIAIATQKGGVGKTTTALAFCAGLASMGYKVLGIDIDPQGNFSLGAGAPTQHHQETLFPVLVDLTPITDVIVKSSQGFDLVRANEYLDRLGKALADAMMVEFRLKKALQPVLSEYDVIIIDCRPALDILTRNALFAATHYLIPTQLQVFPVAGMMDVEKTVARIEPETTFPPPELIGVLPTFHDCRKNLSKDLLPVLREKYKEKCFNVVIPSSAPLEAVPATGKSIYQFDPSSPGARAYKRACYELATRLGLAPNKKGE